MCDSCGLSYPNKLTLGYHIANVHNNAGKGLVCDHCKQPFQVSTFHPNCLRPSSFSHEEKVVVFFLRQRVYPNFYSMH